MLKSNTSITGKATNPDALMLDAFKNDTFISYSRKDQAFVRTLNAAFKQRNRDPWVDWDDIQKGEEWWKAIQRGIEGAHTFIFVISPDSIASPICRQEIDYGAQLNKRFLPIVRREGFDAAQLHPSISSHNWLFFRETDDFNTAFEELVKAIDTDLDYVRLHTRLTLRAIEWQIKQQNLSYLLRGIELGEAEQWLLTSVGKSPQPTDLQSQYINASLQARTASLQARQQAKWTVVFTTILVNMVLVAIGAGWFYQSRIDATEQQVKTDLTSALRVGQIGINGDAFERLVNLGVADAATLTRLPLYQEHQKWLCNVHQVFPNAILRTYIQGDPPDQIRWIGDVSREFATTCQTDLTTRATTEFFQPYTIQTSELAIFKGETITPVSPYYTDDLGTWISVAAAIKDSTGRVVGGIRVDFKKDYVEQEKQRVLSTLIGAYIAIFIWLLVLSLIILRVTRPTEK